MSGSNEKAKDRRKRVPHISVGSLARLIVRVAWTMVMILAPLSAHAGMSCNTANVSKVLTTGVIAVPVSAAIGSIVSTLSPDTFQMKCRFLSTTSPGNVTSATLYTDLGTSAPLAPGFSDVYQTGVAGLGVRYTLNSPTCSTANAVITNGTVRLGCSFSGPLDGPYMPVDVTVTATLIVTGSIAAGASNLMTAPTVTIGTAQSDQAGYWNQPPLYTGSASGVLTHATCSVNQSNVGVTLPTADTHNFATGIGSVAWPQSFALSLSCSAGAKVLITLTDSVNPANRSTTLQLTADSTAKGIGIQLLNSDSTLVAFGADSAAPGNPNQWTIGASPNGTLQIPMTARYVRTGTVSPGTVKALATFTMSYQ